MWAIASDRAKAGSRSRFGRGRSGCGLHPVAVELPSRGDEGARRQAIRHPVPLCAAVQAHMTYLKRDGVTRDGTDARMFDARSDAADERAFAERCKDDRHHFRFIVSPEDAAELDEPAHVHRASCWAMSSATSEQNSTGWRSITGIPTIHMSMF